MDDIMVSYSDILADILSDSTKVLLYSGQDDIIVNTAGWEQFISNLNYSDGVKFNELKRNTWRVGSEIVGFWRSLGKLTEVIVMKAGHMVPKD